MPEQVDAILEKTLDRADDWESHWRTYSDVASFNPAQIMRHELILALLRAGEHRESSQPTRLLDIGCGQGDFLVRARNQELAAEYAGFELSESGVAVSRGKLPGATIMRVDLFAPPADAERFRGWATAAVCSDVIEHVDEDVAFLRAARRYMAPGARLVVTVPGGPISEFDRHIGHRRHYSSERLRNALDEAGFTVDRVHRAGFPFFNLYRLLVIARGRKLIAAVEAGSLANGGRGIEGLAMGSFRFLFRFNRADSRLGWQLVALARA